MVRQMTAAKHVEYVDQEKEVDESAFVQPKDVFKDLVPSLPPEAIPASNASFRVVVFETTALSDAEQMLSKPPSVPVFQTLKDEIAPPIPSSLKFAGKLVVLLFCVLIGHRRTSPPLQSLSVINDKTAIPPWKRLPFSGGHAKLRTLRRRSVGRT